LNLANDADVEDTGFSDWIQLSEEARQSYVFPELMQAEAGGGSGVRVAVKMGGRRFSGSSQPSATDGSQTEAGPDSGQLSESGVPQAQVQLVGGGEQAPGSDDDIPQAVAPALADPPALSPAHAATSLSGALISTVSPKQLSSALKAAEAGASRQAAAGSSAGRKNTKTGSSTPTRPPMTLTSDSVPNSGAINVRGCFAVMS
jgi:hypothetical protein